MLSSSKFFDLVVRALDAPEELSDKSLPRLISLTSSIESCLLVSFKESCTLPDCLLVSFVLRSSAVDNLSFRLLFVVDEDDETEDLESSSETSLRMLELVVVVRTPTTDESPLMFSVEGLRVKVVADGEGCAAVDEW